MANVPQSYAVTAGRKDDLTAIITNISPADTAFLSNFGKGKPAADKKHIYQKEVIRDPAENINVEGQDFVGQNYTPRTELFNYLQLFYGWPWMAGTMERISKAGGTPGVPSEYGRSVKNELRGIARDIEYAMKTGTGNSGTSAVGSQMVCVKNIIPSATHHVAAGTATGGTTIGESKVNQALQTCWRNGGRPDTMYVDGQTKGGVDAFTGNSTRNVEVKKGRLPNFVDILEGSFGVLKVRLDWVLDYINLSSTTGDAYLLEDRYWRKSWLDSGGVTHERLAKTGDNIKGMIKAELTVEGRAPESSSVITMLTPPS